MGAVGRGSGGVWNDGGDGESARWSRSVPVGGHPSCQVTDRGRSGLHRAGCWLTASRGDLQESATENRPPMAMPLGSAQVRVKRCGKSAPANGVTRSARQTPPGARSNRGTDGPSGAPSGVPPPGGPLRWMTTQPSSEGGQNPAYRPAHRQPGCGLEVDVAPQPMKVVRMDYRARSAAVDVDTSPRPPGHTTRAAYSDRMAVTAGTSQFPCPSAR